MKTFTECLSEPFFSLCSIYDIFFFTVLPLLAFYFFILWAIAFSKEGTYNQEEEGRRWK